MDSTKSAWRAGYSNEARAVAPSAMQTPGEQALAVALKRHR
jgi:hypothetical protein